MPSPRRAALPAAIASLSLSLTAALSGCALVEGPGGSPSPTPTASVEPVLDPAGWVHGVPLEEFAAAFPHYDVSKLASIPELEVGRNGRAWSLGSGADGAVLTARDWVEEMTGISPLAQSDGPAPSGGAYYSAVVHAESGQDVSFALTDMDRTGPFLLLVTSST